MSDDPLMSIDSRLKLITKLMAIDVTKGRTFQEQVKLLHDVGMQPSEIAECLGKTANNVRVAVHALKKKKGDNSNDKK